MQFIIVVVVICQTERTVHVFSASDVTTLWRYRSFIIIIIIIIIKDNTNMI